MSNRATQKLWPAIPLTLCLLFSVAPLRSGGDTTTNEHLPSFHELYGLIRSNLTGLSEAALNRAAVLGLLSQLRNHVLLATNSPGHASASEASPLGKSLVFDQAFAYLRLNSVKLGSAHAVAESYEQLRAPHKLSGLVLDLRFAAGDDYEEAAAVADLFLKKEQPLLKWDDAAKRSTAKTNSIDLPLIVLVNEQTAQAAEALAAALRHTNAGLIVGGPTAGHAHVFKEYSLESGRKVRIAAAQIVAGDGHVLSESGLTPDLLVRVTATLERAYLDDPYKDWGPASSAPQRADGPEPRRLAPASPRNANVPGPIRPRKEPSADDAELTQNTREQAPEPIVRDPALARALDLLKGLTLVKTRR